MSDEVGGKKEFYFCVNPAKFKSGNFEFMIPESAYKNYRGRERNWESNGEESHWKFVTPKDEHIDGLAKTLVKRYVGRDWKRTPVKVTKVIVEFVRSLSYGNGDANASKYALETLCQGNGNCADLSVLAVSLTINRGIDSSLVWIPPAGDEDYGHLIAGFGIKAEGEYVSHKGKQYCVADLTTKSSIGKIGNDYDLRNANVLLCPKSKLPK